jgi:hypothetical protein
MFMLEVEWNWDWLLKLKNPLLLFYCKNLLMKKLWLDLKLFLKKLELLILIFDFIQINQNQNNQKKNF